MNMIVPYPGWRYISCISAPIPRTSIRWLGGDGKDAHYSWARVEGEKELDVNWISPSKGFGTQ